VRDGLSAKGAQLLAGLKKANTDILNEAPTWPDGNSKPEEAQMWPDDDDYEVKPDFRPASRQAASDRFMGRRRVRARPA
jgi:hypothetical protein